MNNTTYCTEQKRFLQYKIKQTERVILNTAGEAGEACEAGDVFRRPSYDSPGVPGGGRRHATRLSR